jgi:hypothetical protein
MKLNMPVYFEGGNSGSHFKSTLSFSIDWQLDVREILRNLALIAGFSWRSFQGFCFGYNCFIFESSTD